MKIYLIRHGEAEHNIHHDLDILYPKLSKLGIDQIINIKSNIKLKNNYKIFVSPTLRTLETAIILFPKKNIIAEKSIREVLHNPCDYRKKKSELQILYPKINFNNIDELDPLKLYEIDNLIFKRCDILYNKLKNLKNENIVIISHNGFLYRFLKKYGDELKIYNKSRFNNGEIRIGYL